MRCPVRLATGSWKPPKELSREVGAARLTLDVVAQAAGVSKGGLLYHFPSKESLLGALAQRYVDSMEQCIEAAKSGIERAGPEPRSQGVHRRHPRQRSALEGDGRRVARDRGERSDAARSDPRAPRRTTTSELAASSADFARAAIVTLAIDGLMMRESLRISPFTGAAARAESCDELMKIADESYR